MSSKLKHHVWAILGILFISIPFRLFFITYAYNNPCLGVPEEDWLYDNPQPVSLYGWSVSSAYIQPNYQSTARTIATEPNNFILLRLVGVYTGLLAVALTLLFARKLGANWGWIAGLFVAVGVWFVNPDRWIVRFDPSILAVAASIVLSLIIYQKRLSTRTLYIVEWIRYFSILSLVLLAPPLWWLAIVLLLNNQIRWKPIAAILVGAIIAIPALQVPQNWINAALTWDSGTTAACLWCGLALALWRWPKIRPVAQGMLISIVLIAGLAGIWVTAQLPIPSSSELSLIEFLQDRLPEGVIVQFSPDTYRLAQIVACLHKVNISFEAQKPSPNFPFAPSNPQKLPQPNYVILTDPKEAERLPFVYSVENKFFVENTTNLPYPVDIKFGDVIYLTSYSIISPKVKVGDLVDIRLDYQFSSTVPVEILHNAIYIHLTDVTDPTNVVVNYNVPLAEGPNSYRPRQYVLDQHYRLSVPEKARAGSYNVTLGILDTQAGKRLVSSLGHELTLGTVEVQAK